RSPIVSKSAAKLEPYVCPWPQPTFTRRTREPCPVRRSNRDGSPSRPSSSSARGWTSTPIAEKPAVSSFVSLRGVGGPGLPPRGIVSCCLAVTTTFFPFGPREVIRPETTLSTAAPPRPTNRPKVGSSVIRVVLPTPNLATPEPFVPQ